MKVSEANKEKFFSAMYNLVRATKNEAEHCGELCGGLSEKEIIIVLFVGLNQNVKMSDIADNIEAPMSTLTSIVDKLVEKGYLTRDHSGQDRRVINVSLAAGGKAAYKTVLNEKKKVADKILSQLSEKDQLSLIKHLEIITSSISTVIKK
jgi:DNA-binding MarR family transcriptional regulator